MFAWLWPRPTLDPWEKAWTENGMHWLCQQLGSQRLAEARVATPADFAGGSGPLGADDARAIFRQVCDFLRVDDSRFQLQIAADGPEGGGPRHDAPGSTCQLCLPAPQLADAQRLVATLARELAPEVLRQAGADLRPDEPDFQQRAELVPTYLGLGVFAANCGAAGGRGGWQWWSAERQGSLPCAAYCADESPVGKNRLPGGQ